MLLLLGFGKGNVWRSWNNMLEGMAMKNVCMGKAGKCMGEVRPVQK